MGEEALSELLRDKHAELEHLIEEEENRPLPDYSFVHALMNSKESRINTFDGKSRLLRIRSLMRDSIDQSGTLVISCSQT